MNRLSFAVLVAMAAGAGSLPAQHAGHAAMGTDTSIAPVSGQPPHVIHGWAPPVEDRMRFNYVLLDRLELGTGDGTDVLVWDAQGWYGGDRSKFWWKIEGDQTLAGPSEGEVEFQALFSRLVAPFWDFQTGLRYDRTWGAGRNLDRAFLTFGFEGLAPYWFEIEPAIFISEKGDISARVAVTYDLMLTQKLVLQPRIDLNAAVQDVPSFGIGAGLNNVELGLRLRYEIRREFAPYIGVKWLRQLGDTAALSRAAGAPINGFKVVLGVRIWW
jgi:copper resistance protein B